MHPSSQIHSITWSYKNCMVNVYTQGTCLVNFSFGWRNSKKQLVSNSFNHRKVAGIGVFLVDGQYKTAIAYSVQNKCSMSSTKSIKWILNFSREWWKCLLSVHHMCFYFLWMQAFGHIHGLLAQKHKGPKLTHPYSTLAMPSLLAAAAASELSIWKKKAA